MRVKKMVRAFCIRGMMMLVVVGSFLLLLPHDIGGLHTLEQTLRRCRSRRGR